MEGTTAFSLHPQEYVLGAFIRVYLDDALTPTRGSIVEFDTVLHCYKVWGTKVLLLLEELVFHYQLHLIFALAIQFPKIESQLSGVLLLFYGSLYNSSALLSSSPGLSYQFPMKTVICFQ